jgi:hypothetical protein
VSVSSTVRSSAQVYFNYCLSRVCCVLCVVCVVRRALCVTVTCVVCYGDVTGVVEGRLKNGFFSTNPTRESRSKSDTQRRIILLSLDVRSNIPQFCNGSIFLKIDFSMKSFKAEI